MANKIAEIINYLIGAAIMGYFLFTLKRKSEGQPEMKISGISIKTIVTLIYIGIGIDIILIILILLK